MDLTLRMPVFLVCLTVLAGMTLEMRTAYGQSAGEIAIIGVRADDIDGTSGNGNDEGIAWVTLTNLAGGTVILFTDSGWTAANTFRGSEGAIRYTAPAGGISAGTVMLLEFSRDNSGNYTFSASSTGYSDADDAIVGTTGLLPATPGDNLFIFTGSTASPIFIWSWKNDGPYDADSTSNSTTALPATLTEGVNAMTIELTEDGTDDSRYIGTTSGTAAELALAIADRANWEISETIPFPSGGSDITNGTLGSGGFTVNGGNAAPTITSANRASVPENQTGAIDVQATDDSDTEGAGLTFNLTGGADQALFAINTNNGVVTFNSAPDFEAPADAGADNDYDIQVTVTDSGGLSAVQDIVISVTDVAENTAPVLGAIGNHTVDEGQLLTFTVSATDAEDDTLSFALSNAPTGATLTDNLDGTATFNWSPTFDQAGNYQDVLFTVTDDGAPIMSDNEAITITVGDVNRPPQFDPLANQATDEGVELSFTVQASDPDGNAIALTIANQPTGATFTDNGDGSGTFTWTPDFDQAGNYTVMFTATDNGTPSQTDTLEVTITVGNVNRPPILDMIGDRTVDEGALLEFTLTASDPDADNLSYALGNAPAGASLTDNGDGTATFSWIPGFDQAGNYPGVLFTVTDDGSPTQSDSETITITVGNVNRPPVLNPIGNRTVDEGLLLEFTLTSSDPDGDSLSYALGNAPTGASFTDNGDGTATFSWIPGFDQAGNFTVTFQVVDDGTPSESDTEAVTITVGDVNRPPTLDPIGDRTVGVGELLEIVLTGSDPDGDALGYPVPTNLPSGATLVDNNDGTATFSWTPLVGQTGTFLIEFVVSDGALADSETIGVTVRSGACGGFDVFETAPGVYEAPDFSGQVIVGSDQPDTIVGTNGPDLILGLAGNDVIFARSGDDVICGGSGSDSILGGFGQDALYGEEDNDLLLGGPGDDGLFGGEGDDYCIGGPGNDTNNECE